MEIKFRPHHFLCALCFQGRGYSPAFVANFHSIMTTLTASHGDEALIQVTPQTDSICHPCPNRVETTCQSEEKIKLLDEAHAKTLKIQPHEKMTWGEAKKRIAEQLSLAQFHQICATCQWKPLGICENVLRDFLDKSS